MSTPAQTTIPSTSTTFGWFGTGLPVLQTPSLPRTRTALRAFAGRTSASVLPTSSGVSTAGMPPHSLRRTSCTAGLLSNVPLRDMQHAMRHADSRTTLRDDMARANLDRHAAHTLAAHLTGMSAH